MNVPWLRAYDHSLLLADISCRHTTEPVSAHQSQQQLQPTLFSTAADLHPKMRNGHTNVLRYAASNGQYAYLLCSLTQR